MSDSSFGEACIVCGARAMSAIVLAAAVVDPIWDSQLASVVNTFLVALPPAVSVFWFHDGSSPWSVDSDTLQAAVRDGRLRRHLIHVGLEESGGKLTKRAYNLLRNSPTFLSSTVRLTGASHLLFFERDSVACSADPSSARVLYELASRFDYVGAPWLPKVAPWCTKAGVDPERCCCNSGLSLIHVPRLVEMLTKYPPEGDEERAQNDMYLLKNAPLNVARRNTSLKFRVATAAEAARLSVETVWAGGRQEAPFGVHKPWHDLVHAYRNLGSLARVCPALKLLCPYALRGGLGHNNNTKDYKSAERFVRHRVCEEASTAASTMANTAVSNFSNEHSDERGGEHGSIRRLPTSASAAAPTRRGAPSWQQCLQTPEAPCDDGHVAPCASDYESSCLLARLPPWTLPYARTRCCLGCCVRHWLQRRGLSRNEQMWSCAMDDPRVAQYDASGAKDWSPRTWLASSAGETLLGRFVAAPLAHGNAVSWRWSFGSRTDRLWAPNANASVARSRTLIVHGNRASDTYSALRMLLEFAKGHVEVAHPLSRPLLARCAAHMHDSDEVTRGDTSATVTAASGLAMDVEAACCSSPPSETLTLSLVTRDDETGPNAAMAALWQRVRRLVDNAQWFVLNPVLSPCSQASCDGGGMSGRTFSAGTTGHTFGGGMSGGAIHQVRRRAEIGVMPWPLGVYQPTELAAFLTAIQGEEVHLSQRSEMLFCGVSATRGHNARDGARGDYALAYSNPNASASRAAALAALEAAGACGQAVSFAATVPESLDEEAASAARAAQPRATARPAAAGERREALLARLNATPPWTGSLVHGRERAWRYYAALLHARFVAAPAGAGRDTYRFYEAIVLGAVPVVVRSEEELEADSFKLADLPVLLVEQWADATPERLRRAWTAIRCNTSLDTRRAHLPFWIHALIRP